MNAIEYMQQELQTLKEHSNLRRLPQLTHEGRTVIADALKFLHYENEETTYSCSSKPFSTVSLRNTNARKCECMSKQ